MRMHNPPHPGVILNRLYLEPLDLTVTAAAEALVISRKHLSDIVNGRASITAEIAQKIAKAFSTTAESWLNSQAQYDLWQKHLSAKDLRPVKRLYCPAIVQTA